MAIIHIDLDTQTMLGRTDISYIPDSGSGVNYADNMDGLAQAPDGNIWISLSNSNQGPRLLEWDPTAQQLLNDYGTANLVGRVSPSLSGIVFHQDHLWTLDALHSTMDKIDATVPELVQSYAFPSSSNDYTGLASDGTYLWRARETSTELQFVQVDPADGSVVNTVAMAKWANFNYPIGLAFPAPAEPEPVMSSVFAKQSAGRLFTGWYGSASPDALDPSRQDGGWRG